MLWLLFGLVGLGLWLIHDGLLPKQPRVASKAPSRALARLRDWLVQTGVAITPRTFMLITFSGAVLGGSLAHLVFGWPIVDALGIVVGGAVYPLVLRGRQAGQHQAILGALPEAIDRLRDSLASIPLDVALARLGTDAGPQALRPNFRQLANELALGVPFAEAVRHWADGLADPTADRVASALVLHDRVGAVRFGLCLDQLASALRAELAQRDQVASARSKLVFQARILMVLPVLVLLAVRTSQPIATQAFATGTGQIVLAGAALMLAAGYGLMLHLGRVPAEEREVAAR